MAEGWRVLALLTAGSVAGGLGRFFLSGAVARWSSPPWGTLTVNAAGCFLMGFFNAWSARSGWPPAQRVLWMTGFCGAFTTFSAFAADVAHLGRAGAYGTAALYAAGSVAAGIGFFIAGGSIGR